MFENWKLLKRVRQASPGAADVCESFCPQVQWGTPFQLALNTVLGGTSERALGQSRGYQYQYGHGSRSGTSAQKGPFPAPTWTTAMLTISFLQELLSTCKASSLRPYSFTFTGRDAALPPLGRPQLQHPVVIWWAQLSASLLQKSVLTTSRWPSEEWWLIGSNTCRGT